MSANIIPTIEPVASAITDPNDEIKPLDSEEARRRRYRQQLVQRQVDHEQKLSDFLLGLRNDLKQVDKAAHQKHLEDIDMMCRYVNGEQYGGYEAGVYQPATLQDGDYAYTIPVITGHVEQAFMQLLKTQIEYEASPNDKGGASAGDLAKMCEEIAVEEKNRLMTRDAQMDEILNSILAGESYRCVIWGINPESPKTATRMESVEEMGSTPGRRECQACLEEVPPDATTCPKCGGSYVKDIPGASFTRFAPKPQQVQLAENLLHIPHPTSVQLDLSAQKLKYATFIVERDYLPKHVAEWRYQTILDTEGEKVTEDIRIRQEMERSSMHTDPIVGSSRQQSGVNIAGNRPVVREYIYLDVARYGHFYCSQEETLPDGTKLPTGTILGDKYPNGAFMLVIGNTILKFTGLNLNRRWTAVLYGKRAGSNRGAGLQILMPLNDIVNDSFNLEYSLGMTSHPFTAVARKHVKQLPEANHLLFIDNLPQGGIDSVIKRFSGQSGTGFLGANAERTQAAMQFIGGTSTLTGNYGAPDNKAMSTATGVAASQENASGRQAGPINQRVYADQEMMYQLLENIKEHCTKDKSPEQYKVLEKRFGPDVCQLFFNCNFRQAITFTVAQNTDTPRSTALTQAKAMAFGQIAQAFAKTQAPWAQEVLSTLADTMGLSFNIAPGRTDRREAEYRLNKLAAIEEHISSKNPDYLTDSENAAKLMYDNLAQFCAPLIGADPRAAFLQDHVTFMDAYKDELFSEGAKTWSPARRSVVIQLWMDHFKAQIAMQFEKAAVTKEIQDTLMPEPPQPTPEEIAAAQDAEDERTVAAETLTRQADEAAKDADLDRDMEKREHEAELNLATEQARVALIPNGNEGAKKASATQ